jgi:predicted metal-dependent HD superfamily phosphohydrolase
VSLPRWWRATWTDLGLPEPEVGVFDTLLARYAEPHRAYHTRQHLDECRERFEEARALADAPGAVALALWFHDAIYDPRSLQNEDRSAAWAVRVLAGAGAPAALRRSVRHMILATKHDAMPGSRDAALVVDVDLAILGAAETRFDEYEAQVRREYRWVPEEEFRGARARILRGFLARPQIYATDFFRGRLEPAARANLERAIARLAA